MGGAISSMQSPTGFRHPEPGAFSSKKLPETHPLRPFLLAYLTPGSPAAQSDLDPATAHCRPSSPPCSADACARLPRDGQEARPCAVLHCISALRVRASRPVFSDRHQGRGGRDLIQQRRRQMAQIGTFTRNEDGSFAGVIKTLNLNIKARLVVAEKESDKSPDLRALAGTIEIGAGWKKIAKETGREYHSVKLDDPSFSAPIYASLVENEDGYALIWSR